MESGKCLVLDMRGQKDKIQARGLNVVIPSAHHGPVATNTGVGKESCSCYFDHEHDSLCNP